MNNSILISSQSKNFSMDKFDTNPIFCEFIKECQEQIHLKQLLINTSFCHESIIHFDKNIFEQIFYALFLFFIDTAENKNRIIIKSYIEKEFYYVQFTNEHDIEKKPVIQYKSLSGYKKVLQKYGGDLISAKYKKNSITISFFIPKGNLNKN